jgi:hypothetical protein
MNLERKYDKNKAKHFIEDMHFVLHCHHYNSQLHRAIVATPFFDGKEFIFQVSRDDFYETIKTIIQRKNIKNQNAILNLSMEFYRLSGFGTMDLSGMDENGGKAISNFSHLSTGYKSKWGIQSTPVDDFGRGFIAAAWALAFNKKLASSRIKQTKCISCLDKHNEFILEA